MARENSGRNSLIFRGVVGNKSYILEKSESSWGILCSSLIIIWIWEINGRMNNLLIKLSTASLRIPKREHIEQIIDQWTWVWVNPRSWWWTGGPGVLQSMGSQSWTRLSDWTELKADPFRVSITLTTFVHFLLLFPSTGPFNSLRTMTTPFT